ncbi:hypothetical protein GDO78_010526 [Eleutherodactylus coqui]|uniref:Ribosome receptor lysine/proline rich domain-containing protein n=1 Tax=Eleutherodactylus coqui TaxID=57060 RepID=A0A8J6K674_ELECQ|nr:hypothetical protein GDO78_010526 [Eleutherodactylus coqui]
MEFYEHFLILVPLVVILVSVLFFCLFMKETSYDEVLAKQKKDLKLPSTKIDKKKIDKKKNKKKETQNGNLHESDSETAIRDFDLGDALSSEEEPVTPTLVTPAENTTSVRERKKRDKKQPKPVTEEHVNKEVNGTKVPAKKPEPVPVTKQPTPPPDTTGSKKKQGQKKQKNGQDDSPIKPEPKTEHVIPSKKQESVIPLAEVKPQESGSGKKTVPKKKQKVESVLALVDEPLIHPTVYIPLMDNSDPTVVVKKETAGLEKAAITEVVQKSGGKKGKNVTDKGERKGNYMELVGEKQKSNLVEAKARERIGLLEKEHGVFQSKIHSSYQEVQQMQHKFQQLREQLESQITHLKQENGILRDAVSSATNQMESKQSNELIKLRQDYARLVKELNDKNSSLAQEELQKKNHEQAAAGLKAQMQDAERRWEEVESYLRKRMSDLEMSQQDFQGKLLTKEAEVKSLHSKLTDTIVTNQQLDQRIMQLMDEGQDDSLQMQVQDLLKQNEALNVQMQKYHSQIQAQSSASVIVDELQKNIEEKNKEIRQVKDAVALEQANFANSGEELKTLQRENLSLKGELQKVHAAKSERKDSKIKSVEDFLQAEQLRANKEGRVVQELTKEIEALKEALASSQLEKAEQVTTMTHVQELQNQLKGKEESLKSIEERFHEQDKVILEKERQVEDLQKESHQLKIHIEEVKQKSLQQDSSSTAVQDLHRIVEQQNEKIRNLEEILSERELNITVTTQELTGLKKENEILKIQACELQKKHDQQLRQDLREKNWKAMEALASTEKMLQERVNKTAKERQQNTGENEAREILQKIFPNVSVSASLRHSEWIKEFEKAAKVCLNESGGTEKVKALEQKLKEGEEIHTLLQLECEKYKSVLAETEGILQRLQRSVEEEEGRWKVKLEESQNELTELLKDKEHLETELEKAENERTTYVSEVRELKDLLTELQRKLDDSYSEAVRQNEELTLLKTQLNETLVKLEGEQTERQKVANDVHEAQKSLDFIQLEILKGSSDSNVIENSDISTEMDEQQKEKMSSSLSQTVTQLQQRLQAVNQQLTKGQERFQVIG